MIRTLQVIGSLDAGGAQTFAINYARSVVGGEVLCDFAIDHPEYDFYKETIVALGAKLHVLPELSKVGPRAYKKAWATVFNEGRYDIVHAHARSTASLYLSVAEKAGVATVSHSHSTSNGTGVKAVVKDLLKGGIAKSSDLCLACSKEAGKWLFGDYPFEVVPNAIHVEDYAYSETSRAKVREELGIPGSAFVYGHVGRFNQVKNHDYIVDVFSEALNYHPDARLLLVGDGELRKAIEEKCRQLGIYDKVSFVGNTHNVAPYYSAMDCMVFPSLWEGIPVTLVEAQAADLPCVVSARVNHESALVDNLVTFIPLEERGKWNTALEAAYESQRHRNPKSPVSGSQYDMACQAERLTGMYRTLLNG